MGKRKRFASGKSGVAEKLGAETRVSVDFRATTTPDGKSAVYSAGGNLWSMSVEGTHESKTILQALLMEIHLDYLRMAASWLTSRMSPAVMSFM